jgi:thioesterase domain-containing protein
MGTVTRGIRLLRGTHNDPALFCLYDINFETLAPRLPTHLAVYGLMAAGEVEFPDTGPSVERLAQTHLVEVRKTQPRGPYSLLGYSFGGLVAYEMAVQLHRAGVDVSLLAMIDTEHPSFHSTLSPAELEVARRVYRADRIKKYLTNLRNGRIDRLAMDAWSLTRRRLGPLAWRLAERVRRVTGNARLEANTDAAIEFMSRAYTPSDFGGSILLIRAQGRDAEFAPDQTMGWRKCTHGVEVRFATCSHETMMGSEHSTELAGLLTPFLPIGTPSASATHGN